MKELLFLAGVFFDYELPKEKQYLFKYFRTKIERQFLRYYFCFGDFDNFTDNTGYYCQTRWLRLLKKRLDAVVATHDKAKSDWNTSLLAKIESGKYKLKQIKSHCKF